MVQIRVLNVGMNQRWYRRAADIDDSMDDIELANAGIVVYKYGPAHFNHVTFSAKSREQVYEQIGGKPDVILWDSLWRSHLVNVPGIIKNHVRNDDAFLADFRRVEDEIVNDESIPLCESFHDFWIGREFKVEGGCFFNPYYSPGHVDYINSFLPTSKIYHVPFSVKAEYAYDERKYDKRWDICIPGADAPQYHYRKEAWGLLAGQPYISNALGSSAWITRPVQQEYIDILKATKICVFCGSFHKAPFKKLVEMLAAGSFVIAQPDLPWYKDIGLESGIHFIEAPTERLVDIVRHYLARDEERERIAAAGRKFFLEHLTPFHITRNWIVPMIRDLAEKGIRYKRIFSEG